MKYLGWVLACLVLPATVLAASEYQVAKRAEASMVVTGWIVVNPDGSVNSYTLDRQDKLPPEVVQLIAKALPHWEFQPISILDKNGKPSMAKAKMSLRVVASPSGADKYALSIHGASFGAGDPGKDPSIKTREPPHYPEDALERGVSGIVYLALKVDPQGRVEDADARQVDLRFVANDGEMKAWGRVLAVAAIRAARNWTFNIPATSVNADGYDVVRVPVNFEIGHPHDEYGQWDAYVPGMAKQIPWAHVDTQAANGSADAIPNNGLAFEDDHRFVLLNPPGNG